MAVLRFILRDGEERVVSAPTGGSLMEAAVAHGIDGIDALCGGACACGTCHVLVDPEWRAACGPAGSDEQALLDSTGQAREGSRLGCQLQLHPGLDGLCVTVAPEAS